MLTSYDGGWVSGDTGSPLKLLLSDDEMVVDPSDALTITVRLRERATNRLVEGTCTANPWPDLVDGNPAVGVFYDWHDGGDDLHGEVEIECRLGYTDGPLTFPTTNPPIMFFRDPT